MLTICFHCPSSIYLLLFRSKFYPELPDTLSDVLFSLPPSPAAVYESLFYVLRIWTGSLRPLQKINPFFSFRKKKKKNFFILSKISRYTEDVLFYLIGKTAIKILLFLKHVCHSTEGVELNSEVIHKVKMRINADSTYLIANFVIFTPKTRYRK